MYAILLWFDSQIWHHGETTSRLKGYPWRPAVEENESASSAPNLTFARAYMSLWKAINFLSVMLLILSEVATYYRSARIPSDELDGQPILRLVAVNRAKTISHSTSMLAQPPDVSPSQPDFAVQGFIASNSNSFFGARASGILQHLRKDGSRRGCDRSGTSRRDGHKVGQLKPLCDVDFRLLPSLSDTDTLCCKGWQSIGGNNYCLSTL